MSDPILGAEPDFHALRAGAARKRRFVVGGLLAVAVAAVTIAFVSVQRKDRAESEALSSDLRGCLLGAPLDPGETVPARYRRLQLRALGKSDSERITNASKLWPLACRVAAERVLDKLKGTASAEELKPVTTLVKVLSDPTLVGSDATETLEATFKTLDALLPAPVPRGKDALPPVVLNVDTLTSVPALSKKGTALSRCYTEDNPGISLPVLIDEEGLPAPLLCSFDASSDEARCRSLGEVASVRGHGLRLLGTSDRNSETIVFAGRRGSEGVFVAGSPEPIDRLYSYGGYVSQDHRVSVLGWDEENRNMVLVEKPPGGKSGRTPLRPNFRVSNYFYDSQLLWDQVLVRGITPENERRLFVLPLGKPGSFELADIGELEEPGLIRAGEEEKPHLTGCRTEKATVIRARGTDNDALTFRLDRGFTMPVHAPTRGVLGCHETTATVVRAQGSGSNVRLFHDACTSAGCTHRELKGDALDKGSSDLRPQEPEDIAAVDLAGKLLVVWIAGERGGLRMRIAPPDTFSRVDDVLVLDDHVLGGKNARESTILGFRLYSRERFAVLLLSTLSGVHAFRIDPEGALKPWKMKT